MRSAIGILSWLGIVALGLVVIADTFDGDASIVLMLIFGACCTMFTPFVARVFAK